MTAPGADPFIWDTNDEDEVCAECDCGWVGPWREWMREVREDEDRHVCSLATEWRAAR